MSKKNHDEQTRNVKSGEKRREQRHSEDRHVVFVGELEDRVLAEESAERWTAHERERPGKKRHERNGEIFGKAAHLPNVLFVMQRDDDGAGAEKEQRFEKRVREKMEHGGVA